MTGEDPKAPRRVDLRRWRKEAGVISASLCRRLRKAQRIRNLIEHDYDKVTAGQLHELAEDIRDLVPDFLRPFGDWIAPQL